MSISTLCRHALQVLGRLLLMSPGLFAALLEGQPAGASARFLDRWLHIASARFLEVWGGGVCGASEMWRAGKVWEITDATLVLGASKVNTVSTSTMICSMGVNRHPLMLCPWLGTAATHLRHSRRSVLGTRP